jgi:hypothetical protein
VELFDFEQSLVGEAAALRTLAWQGGGEPVYVDGWPYNAAPLSLLISKGKLGWEGDDEELDAADWDRALDGTANSYLHYAKRRLVWPLAGLTYGDAIALRAAYLSGKPLTLSRNCDEPAENSRGYIFASPPKLQEILANLWSGEAEFDEV